MGTTRRLAMGLGLLLAGGVGAADNGPASAAPVLTPKAVISLEYPNPWDFNKLIALTPDGRYLVDASDKTRHIRVWDWQEKTVAKRLLLNEEAPEFSDGKVHKSVLRFAGGHELMLSPDGRFMAACAGKGTMIWDLGSGQRLAHVGGIMNPVPGIPEEARASHSCSWLSFSPDGSLLAVAGGGMMFQTAQDWEAYQKANARTSDLQMRGIKLTPEDFADLEKGKDKSFTGGVALYDTRDWRIVRFLRLRPWEHVKSPVLFTADGKQAIGLANQFPAVFPKEVINTPATEQYITSRLVRWDVATGEIVASIELPKLAPGSVFVKWSWLPGGREVWWQTWLRVDYEYQTEPDVWNCRATAPAFESEVAENCGYWWAVSVLDIETGKRRYLAPVKKNIPRKLDTVERIGASVRISPDGRHLALLKSYQRYPRGESSLELMLTRVALDLYDLATAEITRTYSQGPEGSSGYGGIGWLTFSNDSRFFAFKQGGRSYIFGLNN